MANSIQARKRARQAVIHRARNMSQRSTMRTSIKKFLKMTEAGDTQAAGELYREVASELDRAARKGLEHRNKAARLKRRLNARLKAATSA
ncbi:MAG: 30S ribosomal protein S20 [Arenicellales bacterium]|nr:30S ribosomal protein S20 [Arenicellales bacterium]